MSDTVSVTPSAEFSLRNGEFSVVVFQLDHPATIMPDKCNIKDAPHYSLCFEQSSFPGRAFALVSCVKPNCMEPTFNSVFHERVYHLNVEAILTF
jgi:hypothetical protein